MLQLIPPPQGEELIKAGNHNHDAIEQRCEGLREKLEILVRAAERRKAHLIENSAFLQFLWKTDVVESWIADKEAQIMGSDTDYGRDLSSVQTLLTKQETFDAGLQVKSSVLASKKDVSRTSPICLDCRLSKRKASERSQL